MKRILILGGNRYNVLAIESIKKNGMYAICIDRDTQAEARLYANEFYCIDFSKKELVYEIAKNKEVDAIIPTNDWGVISAAYASERLGLLFINEKVAEIATDKYLMRTTWLNQGIDMPWFKQISELNEIDVNQLTYPCIFKPQDSRVAGSRGVKVVYSKNDVSEAYQFAKQYSKNILIEELLVGKEHSAEILIENGNYHVIAISDKVKTPYPYRVDKEVVYPTYKKEEELVSLKTAIINAVKALGINIGAAHLELCATNDGRFIPFEIGARCGGGGTPNPIIKYVTGIDMMVEFCHVLLGEKVDFPSEPLMKDCVYHFITPEEGTVQEIDLKYLNSNETILDYSIFLSVGDYAKKVKEGPDRAGFVISKTRHFNSDHIIKVH